MASGLEMRRTLEGVPHGVGAPVRWLASLKLTVALLVLLAAALGCGGFLEAAKGREWVQWSIYSRGWFIGLLAVLAANIAAATWVRVPRPWGWPALVLALAPVGVVVLLAGCIQTLVQGIEGRLMLFQGETTQTVMLTHRSQLTLLSPRGKDVQSTELGFSPGPTDWRSDQPLDFGKVDGRGIKVLRFYRHARYQPEWVADDAGLEKPGILVTVSDAHGGGSRTLVSPRPVSGHVLHFESQRRVAGCCCGDLSGRFRHLPASHGDPLERLDDLVGRGPLLLGDELDVVGRLHHAGQERQAVLHLVCAPLHRHDGGGALRLSTSDDRGDLG